MGIDLGINNFAALAYEDGHAELYPLNCLKQDDYYFSKQIAHCDDSGSEQATRLNQKKSTHRTHYFHTLSKHIVDRCVEEGVGTIAVGDLSGIREDEETSESKNWGRHGNLDLHSWAFDRFTDLLEYKAEMECIAVKEVSERDTSKSCSCCGQTRDANRVERGLYACDSCGMVANADMNGAKNIREKVTPSLACDGGDRSTGWLVVRETVGLSSSRKAKRRAPFERHSHRRTCLTRKLVRSHLKNRSRRKPQYPNAVGNPRASAWGGCQDGYHGGIGLAPNGYDQIEELLQHTWGLLADCGCSDDCPACIQSPHCGRANEPLDKRLAVTLTMALADPNRQGDTVKPKSKYTTAANGQA